MHFISRQKVLKSNSVKLQKIEIEPKIESQTHTVSHVSDPRAQELETGGSGVQSQPRICNSSRAA